LAAFQHKDINCGVAGAGGKMVQISALEGHVGAGSGDAEADQSMSCLHTGAKPLQMEPGQGAGLRPMSLTRT